MKLVAMVGLPSSLTKEAQNIILLTFKKYNSKEDSPPDEISIVKQSNKDF